MNSHPQRESALHSPSPAGKVALLALFVALSASIQAAENAFFPSSLPFRPGFANVITLTVLALYGTREAVLVAAARSVLAAVVTGKLLAVPFFLGITGGVASALVMGLLFGRFQELSPVGVSVAGAFTHSGAQLMLICLFIIPGGGIWPMVPWVLLTALLAGLSVGFAARGLLGLPLFKKPPFHEGIGAGS